MPNDLILAREAPAGNVAIIKDGQTVCLGQRTVHLRPNREKVDPDFLCYYLLAPKQQGGLLAGETGATAAHVNMRDIRRLDLGVLPDLTAQEKAGATIAAYDDLIENNRRRIALLEEAARMLYREWFVRFRFPGHEHVRIVDGIPHGWERCPFGQIAELNYGKALKEENRVDGDFPVYGSSGVVGTHQAALVEGPTIVVGRRKRRERLLVPSQFLAD
jgi:type I restriction enzyme S subunit